MELKFSMMRNTVQLLCICFRRNMEREFGHDRRPWST